MTDHVWPEDQGTNSEIDDPQEGDYNDAANHASAYYNPNASDFVVSGLNVSYDEDEETIDISDGKAYISAETAETAQTDDVRQYVTYDVQPDERNDIDVEDGEVNYVFLNVLLEENDSLEYVINITDEQPLEPSLKIAEVDLT